MRPPLFPPCVRESGTGATGHLDVLFRQATTKAAEGPLECSELFVIPMGGWIRIEDLIGQVGVPLI